MFITYLLNSPRPQERGKLLFVLNQLVFFYQSLGNIVKCCIDVFAALAGAVHLGNLYILVDADTDRDTWE